MVISRILYSLSRSIVAISPRFAPALPIKSLSLANIPGLSSALQRRVYMPVAAYRCCQLVPLRFNITISYYDINYISARFAAPSAYEGALYEKLFDLLNKIWFFYTDKLK